MQNGNFQMPKIVSCSMKKDNREIYMSKHVREKKLCGRKHVAVLRVTQDEIRSRINVSDVNIRCKYNKSELNLGHALKRDIAQIKC